MLLVTKVLTDAEVHGSDARLGSVEDLLFDDSSWRIRYIVINTRRWLPGRKIVLPPSELEQCDWLEDRVTVARTRKELEKSPPLRDHEPVSMQRESEIVDYFDWPRMWGTSDALGTETPMGVGAEVATAGADNSNHPFIAASEGDPHLRSTGHVLGHTAQAEDGECGKVDEMIVDVGNWRIDTLVLAVCDSPLTRTRYAIEPEAIGSIDWKQRRVHLKLKRKQLEGRTEFDPAELVNYVRHSQQHYDFYGNARRSP